MPFPDPEPRYDKLTVEILAGMPDNKLDFAIYDFILSLIFKDETNTDEAILNLSAGLQMVYFTLTLEGEVSNGGFNQYFFNSSGRYVFQTLDALALIGANDCRSLLQKVIAIHLSEQENQKLQSLYSQRTLQSFFETYKHRAW